MCGADTLENYSLEIFRRANVQMNNHMLAITFPSGMTFGYIISSCIMSHVKRKHQFIFGVILMGISQAILGFALKADVIFIRASSP